MKVTEVDDKGRNLVEEFKVFISRGNIIELAIGLTVGVAFTAFVNSLVNNIFLPLVSAIFNQDSFERLYVPLDGNEYDSLEAAEAAGAAILKYGQFISDFINFLIIALIVFFIIKSLNIFGSGIYNFEEMKDKDFKKGKAKARIAE